MAVLSEQELRSLEAIVRRLQGRVEDRKASEALSSDPANMSMGFVKLALAAVIGLESGHHSIALEQVKYLPRMAQDLIKVIRVKGQP